MYRTPVACGRRKLRCVLVGCLATSVLLSVVLLLCNHGNSSFRSGPSHHEDIGRVIRAGYHDTVVVQGQVKLVLQNGGADNKIKATPSDTDDYAAYDGLHEDDKDDDDHDEGYYGNPPEAHPAPPRTTSLKLRVPARGHDNGFHIDDKADYNQEYDDSEEGEDEDEDDDEYVGDYENHPFKKGDFDYNANHTLKFKLHTRKNTSESQKYDSGQFKTMHLLEDSRNVRGDKRNTSNAVVNSAVRLKDQRNIHEPNPQVRPQDQRPQLVKLHNVTFGYRKDGVSYPGTANLPRRDPIETQIPIQTGGHDSGIQDPPATQIQVPEVAGRPVGVRSDSGVPLVADNIYWSQDVEDLVPQGIVDDDFSQLLYKLSTTPVREMRPPQWNRCGRPSNQFIVLEDGTQFCARHRDQHVKLIHGEVLSFYLSRILGLDNVPVVVLSEANSSLPQWRGQNIEAAGWNQSSIVALIQWIHGLDSERSRVKLPVLLLEAYEQGSVFDRHHPQLPHLTANQLTDLLQWSDLILFDYLTAHYDRVASMQDGADREERPSIMHENMRNLRKVWDTGKLWLLDNESGLLDAYSLLYKTGEVGTKFLHFHEQILATNCIFRRSTVQKLVALAALESPHTALVKYAQSQDPLYHRLAPAPEMELVQKYFTARLKRVTGWLEHCSSR